MNFINLTKVTNDSLWGKAGYRTCNELVDEAKSVSQLGSLRLRVPDGNQYT